MQREIRTAPKRNTGLTCIELLMIIALIGIGAAIILPSLGGHGEAPRRASCANNLKQLGLVLKMYSNESEGEFYPPMQLTDCNGGTLTWSKTMDMALVYPEYLTDLLVLECPSNYYIDRGEKADAVWYSEDPVNPDFPQDNPFALNDVVEPCEMMESSYTYYSHLLLAREETEFVTQESLDSFRQVYPFAVPGKEPVASYY